jgi:YjjG family noncanonical pyrimidine nucleotidase
LPRIRSVLFDLDHTLLDFDRAQRAALRAALAEEGLACSPAVLATYRRINDELWARYRRGEIAQSALARERFRRLLAHMGGDPRRAPGLDRRFLAQLSRRGDRLPGCRPTLSRLRRRYRLGVVTNGIDRVQRARLRAASLEGFFEAVVTSEGCGFAKPDPRIVKSALEALGVAPGEALYVGDDAGTDGAAAAAAGVAFCWMDHGLPLPRGVPRPRRRLTRLVQLADILNV